MGNKNLAEGADGIEESTYSVISFAGRSLPDQYRNLVLSKWLRTLRYGNDYFKLVDSDAYFKSYDAYIKSVILRPGSVVRLAVLSDAKDVALGWSVIENKILHYVYVSHEQRNRGIGMSLIPNRIETITHLTKAGIGIWNKKFSHAQFNPFL